MTAQAGSIIVRAHINYMWTCTNQLQMVAQSSVSIAQLMCTTMQCYEGRIDPVASNITSLLCGPAGQPDAQTLLLFRFLSLEMHKPCSSIWFLSLSLWLERHIYMSMFVHWQLAAMHMPGALDV